MNSHSINPKATDKYELLLYLCSKRKHEKRQMTTIRTVKWERAKFEYPYSLIQQREFFRMNSKNLYAITISYD